MQDKNTTKIRKQQQISKQLSLLIIHNIQYLQATLGLPPATTVRCKFFDLGFESFNPGLELLNSIAQVVDFIYQQVKLVVQLVELEVSLVVGSVHLSFEPFNPVLESLLKKFYSVRENAERKKIHYLLLWLLVVVGVRRTDLRKRKCTENVVNSHAP